MRGRGSIPNGPDCPFSSQRDRTLCRLLSPSAIVFVAKGKFSGGVSGQPWKPTWVSLPTKSSVLLALQEELGELGDSYYLVLKDRFSKGIYKQRNRVRKIWRTGFDIALLRRRRNGGRNTISSKSAWEHHVENCYSTGWHWGSRGLDKGKAAHPLDESSITNWRLLTLRLLMQGFPPSAVLMS